jgi:sugar lactone lactonase YvrE
MNATGLAFSMTGELFVTSRYDGNVYAIEPSGRMRLFTEGMGIATGIAFDRAGNLYIGDRSGSVFKISPDREIFVFATLEPSLAAYHMAFGMDNNLYMTGPTTSSFDSIYRVMPNGEVEKYFTGLGRPQGLAVDIEGNVFVIGSYRGRPWSVSNSGRQAGTDCRRHEPCGNGIRFRRKLNDNQPHRRFRLALQGSPWNHGQTSP